MKKKIVTIAAACALALGAFALVGCSGGSASSSASSSAGAEAEDFGEGFKLTVGFDNKIGRASCRERV